MNYIRFYELHHHQTLNWGTFNNQILKNRFYKSKDSVLHWK